jgi:hypothetical protein
VSCERGCGEREEKKRRREREGEREGDSLALHQIQRVDLGGAVAVAAHHLDVAEERGVRVAVRELVGRVCVSASGGHAQSGSVYLLGTR